MKKTQQHHQLDGPEFYRLIARMGGLWSVGMLADLCGDYARGWCRSPGFPVPAWVAGKTRLWSGWEVHDWLQETGRLHAAELLSEKMAWLGHATHVEVCA